MTLYRYRARTRAGELLQSTIDADSEQDAAAKLRAQGYLVTHIELNNDILAARDRRQVKGSQRVTLKDLAIFARQLATLINAGVPLLASLRVLRMQTNSARLALALDAVYSDLQSGATLAAALRKHPKVFPDMMTNTVAAGEIGGALDEVLDRVARHFEKEYELSQKIRSALAYPTIVLVMAVVVVGFLLAFVLPNFVGLFADMGATLPLPTRILLGLGSFLRDYWYLVIAVVAGSVYAYLSWSRTESGLRTVDGIKIKLPIVGPLFLGRTVSAFARSMAILTRSGVPIMASLGVVERIADNALVRDALREAQQTVRAGHSLAGPLADAGIFPPLVIQMISVGEETGHLDTLLEKVADFYDREVEAIVARLGSTLEPVMIGLLAIVVGFIVMAIMLPMFSQYNIMGR